MSEFGDEPGGGFGGFLDAGDLSGGDAYDGAHGGYVADDDCAYDGVVAYS